MRGNQFICSRSSVNFGTQNGTLYGFHIPLNQWWYLGYSCLNVSLSVVMAGNETYCWMGKLFLSANSTFEGGYTTILTNGGIMGSTVDYRNPSSGGYVINVDEVWNGSGGNFARFFGTLISSGVAFYKIYG